MVENKISLIVTSFNASGYLSSLERFFDKSSALFQEIIVVDDCSTDNTYFQLQKLQKRYKIRLIQTESNTGRPSIPRNIGIKEASSELIMFLDVDDFIPREYIKNIIKQKNPEYIYSGTKVPINIHEYKDDYKINFNMSRLLSYQQIETKNFICFSGVCMPSKIAKKYKFLNEPLEDFLYWRKILKENKNLKICKYLDVPIGYNSDISLSPNKAKQLKRISNHLRGISLLRYFLNTLLLRIYETILFLKYKNFLKNNN